MELRPLLLSMPFNSQAHTGHELECKLLEENQVKHEQTS